MTMSSGSAKIIYAEQFEGYQTDLLAANAGLVKFYQTDEDVPTQLQKSLDTLEKIQANLNNPSFDWQEAFQAGCSIASNLVSLRKPSSNSSPAGHAGGAGGHVAAAGNVGAVASSEPAPGGGGAGDQTGSSQSSVCKVSGPKT